MQPRQDETQRIAAYEKARRIMSAQLSPRYRELDLLERYEESRQYEGKPNFWTGLPAPDGQPVPMHERAPCFVYPITRIAIRQHVAFALGTLPKITSHGAEDDVETESGDIIESDLSDYDLDEKDSAILDAFILALAKHSKLLGKAKKLLRDGMRAKSAVAILCARNGRIHIDTTRAKWCTPTFQEGDCRTVEQLEIKYPYLKEGLNPDTKKFEVIVYWYRRVIDAMRDVTFMPLEIKEGIQTTDDDFVENEALSFDHNLGFCPVIWYAHRAEVDSTEVFDGHAIHELQRDQIDALNMSLSQRHRAAFYSGDPQIVETGVTTDENPAPTGRVARVDTFVNEHGQPFTMQGPMRQQMGEARQKGAGTVWTYRSPDAKVYNLTLSDGALNCLSDDARDNLAKIREAMAFVSIDPESVKFSAELSGKAFAMLFARQIAYDTETREDFGEECILKLIDMMLRFVVTVTAQGKALNIRGLHRVIPILKRFQMTEAEETARGEQEYEEETEAPHIDWVSPELDLVWQPFFQEGSMEQQQLITGVKTAYEAKLITRQIGIEKLAALFNIKSPEVVAEALEKEAEIAMQHDMQAIDAMKKGPKTQGRPPPGMNSQEKGGEE